MESTKGRLGGGMKYREHRGYVWWGGVNVRSDCAGLVVGEKGKLSTK